MGNSSIFSPKKCENLNTLQDKCFLMYFDKSTVFRSLRYDLRLFPANCAVIS